MTIIKAAATLGILALIAVGFTLVHLPILKFFPSKVHVLPHIFHRIILQLLNIKLDIEGSLVPSPALLTVNHISWLDISVLGALGNITFIAKKEVAGWPGFGILAKLQRSVFVDRKNPRQAIAAKHQIQERFDLKERIVLFAEGTSSDGNRVLPFRTPLFSVASHRLVGGDEIRLQPVSLAYTHLHGLPIDRPLRPKFAWYGDMSMVPHVWELLCLGPIDVKIILHAPVTLSKFENRKQLAAYCEARVRSGFLSALLGRPVQIQTEPDQQNKGAKSTLLPS
jgi:1-acyl-sn-glycerol-3-phosphate acyltransferase